MIGFLDFTDTLAEVFKDHDCINEGDMGLLKHRKVAIHIDNMSSIILNRTDSDGGIENSIRSARSMLKQFKVDTITVFNGINFGTNDDLHRNTLICSHLFWRLLSVKMMHDTATTKLNEQFLSIYKATFLISRSDSYIHYLTALYFSRMIMKVYKNNSYDHIVAPQLTNNQLAFMLAENDVDCIFTDPTAFIHDEVNQIICEFDEKNSKFLYFDINKLASKLKLSIPVLRKIILALQVYFILSPEFNKKTKHIEARLKPLPNLVENYQFEVDRRKAAVYKIIDMLKEKIRGTEKVIELMKILTTVLELDKTLVNSYLNALLRGPAINNKGEVTTFPEKRGLGKSFVVDISNKEFILYYSLGYIDDELFYLVNKCTDNILNIKPTRADSLEADYCIINFYSQQLQRALYKILLIAYGEDYKLENKVFRLKFQQQKFLDLKIEEKNIQLWTLKESKFEKITFLTCITELCGVWVKKRAVDRFDASTSISENELLFHIFIHLLDDLMHIKLQNNSLLMLGAMLMKIGHSKFEEEIIIFLELVKLGLIKGDTFNPSNLENINKIDLPSFNQSTVKSESEMSYCLKESSELFNKSQKDFFEGVKNFKKMIHGYNTLTLYQIETSVDKIFESLFIIKKKLELLELPNYIDICRDMDIYLSTKVHSIKILSKMTTLSNYDYINHTKLCDFEVYQFTEIVQIIALGLRHSLSSQLLYTFHFNRPHISLDLLHRVHNRLPFSRYYAAECGALMKILVVKTLLCQFLEKKFSVKLTDVTEELSVESVSASSSLGQRFIQTLSNSFSFISLAIEFCKGNIPAFGNIHDDLVESKQMLADYMDFIGLSTGKIL